MRTHAPAFFLPKFNHDASELNAVCKMGTRLVVDQMILPSVFNKEKQKPKQNFKRSFAHKKS